MRHQNFDILWRFFGILKLAAWNQNISPSARARLVEIFAPFFSLLEAHLRLIWWQKFWQNFTGACRVVNNFCCESVCKNVNFFVFLISSLPLREAKLRALCAFVGSLLKFLENLIVWIVGRLSRLVVPKIVFHVSYDFPSESVCKRFHASLKIPSVNLL